MREFSISDELIDESCELAATLCGAERNGVEKREAQKMARLLGDEDGKELTFRLADEVFRPPSAEAQAQTFRRLVSTYGVPKYLRWYERLMMRMGVLGSRILPGVVMPLITEQIRKDSSRVILAREDEKLDSYLEKRGRVNLNLLGEAILGEEEAVNRLERNLELLEKEEANYLSVKISAIFSQINLLDEEGTLRTIQERLRRLYRTGKFINLDMEEYRDLGLTCEAFKRTLEEEEFVDLEAGIVLQAYLPDSFEVLEDLTSWARGRTAPIKVRIVKGANLAMEKVEASQHDWPQAPYEDKTDVDANFKRLLLFAMRPENAAVVKVGVASHNLFDVAFSLLLRKKMGVEERVELEMLEGMANEHARALKGEGTDVLFYAPVVRQENFHSAIAYLVRRLDENTSEENFLAHVFAMEPGDQAFKAQEARFREACRRVDSVKVGPNRIQDRSDPIVAMGEEFENSAETDWVLRANRDWLDQEIESYTPSEIPQMLGMEEVREALVVAEGSGWSETSREERARLLRKVGMELDLARGALIAVMRVDADKRPFEADVEVSEAVDFANYYACRCLDDSYEDGVRALPLGVVVVTPPWNFPCAIPCGGILAALAEGNSVIIKPAPEVVQTGWEMVQCLWRAGIPKDALQFVRCPDNEVGKELVSSEKVKGVILTGSSQTADLFQGWNEEMSLFAETSGKNALVVTAACDPDLAVKDLVRSAFGHSGQKCSAASVALIEGDLYDNELFMTQLRDAAASLPVGEATEPAAMVTPLIQEPGKDLLRGLTELDSGESWLLEPKKIAPRLWSPGIRLGVKAGSWIHQTELFGPVLALIRVENLDEAIAIQNSSDFGLTGGIHSLDPEEIVRWRESVEVGNAYINRPITGAIVRRQPFGGWKRSCVGPGAKAGGPNYLVQFSEWENVGRPTKRAEISREVKVLLDELGGGDELRSAAESYAYWWKEEFSKEHDPSGLLGETNHFRYRVAPEVVCESPDSLQLIAAATVGTRVVKKSANPLAKVLPQEGLVNGRLELLRYLNEQSVSETTHRHGRVG